MDNAALCGSLRLSAFAEAVLIALLEAPGPHYGAARARAVEWFTDLYLLARPVNSAASQNFIVSHAVVLKL